MILFVVTVSFIITSLLITDPEPHVCNLVKRTDDCNFLLKGE